MINTSSIEYVPSSNSLNVHIGGSTSTGLCMNESMLGNLFLSIGFPVLWPEDDLPTGLSLNPSNSLSI